jgi:hypothetical protein
MEIDESLRRRLRAIEALTSGGATAGERDAAVAALVRIKERLHKARNGEGLREVQFSMADAWSRKLFVAYCRRLGLEPYRYPRQRHTTVLVRAPRSFVDEVLWPGFRELNASLSASLNDITDRVIRQEVHGDVSEVIEVTGQLPDPKAAADQ